MRSRVWPLAALCILALWGCGGDDEPEQQASTQEKQPAAETKTQKRKPREKHAPRLRCPADAGNCRSARGTVIYVEAVDPDGDGDAHFVLNVRRGITGPALTVIDVAKQLRPHPLPDVGDEVSAVGPVYRGSHGQRQIQATRVEVARR